MTLSVYTYIPSIIPSHSSVFFFGGGGGKEGGGLFKQESKESEQKINEDFNAKKQLIFYQFEIFVIKAAERHVEENKKICDICHHKLKNIPCYVMSYE